MSLKLADNRLKRLSDTAARIPEVKRKKNKKDKKKAKQKALRKAARKTLKKYANPEHVMQQGNALSGKKLLKLSYLAGDYPYPEKMGLEEYEHEKHLLQTELLKAQNWVRQSGQRIVSLFEGRDAAGKGGTIKRFMEHLNPRAAHVVALEKPTEIERGQWYFQRYIQHLPTRGQMVFFDRSWYNRAGVEKVMGFTTDSDYLEFMRQVPALERMLVNTGLILNKYWFSVTRQEQLRRFHSRQNDPLKQWKLSPIDLQSLDKWDDYTQAKKAMFFHTDTADAPWTVVKSDDKKRARINVMRHFLSTLDYPDKDESIVGTPDPKIIGSVRDIYANQDESRD